MTDWKEWVQTAQVDVCVGAIDEPAGVRRSDLEHSTWSFLTSSSRCTKTWLSLICNSAKKAIMLVAIAKIVSPKGSPCAFRDAAVRPATGFTARTTFMTSVVHRASCVRRDPGRLLEHACTKIVFMLSVGFRDLQFLEARAKHMYSLVLFDYNFASRAPCV
ncbi:uncharacterized protein B0I36DRAFT_355040 [Microdochium trichocladiopsis]|uniref:Uncharacterized protein n=1 Tax=Microdochium trichocladiopsis TaxID=1682393 RepID=A0A9P8XT01_9PEZI|nr:uncharacterized protein B0I36DRAFT_355040 [Microdochium trichocladiopsis]KAH7016201.1 hypothetical protein B0I36DRAFT_355040 [Microdochium trichocladiopsis]